MTENSCSKTNLYLKVTRRRPDGYHELETVFQPLDEPADRISAEWNAAPGIRVSGSLPGLPEDLDNLAGRAAKAYAERAGIEPVWSFFIEKNIPVAAGMGGGSSNAGAVLRMLQNRFQALPETELAEIALRLGADVPFFLSGRVAVATGVGEIFRYPEKCVCPGALLLVNPGFPVSAKWAYTHLDPASIGAETTGKLELLLEGMRKKDVSLVAAGIHNDLAPALFRKFPLLRQLRRTMLESGALAVEVSGSGPTLFALCADEAARGQVAAAVRSAFSPDALRIFNGRVRQE